MMSNSLNKSLYSIKKEKNTIRDTFKYIRNQLNESFVQSRSNAIYNKFIQIVNLNKFNSICIYISFRNEVLTNNIIKKALKSNIKVSVPYIIDSNSMKLKYIKNLENDLVINSKFGSSEPNQKCEDCDINEVTMFIVPGVAFDEKGYRLGFGNGFYDNLLKQNKKALRIGLAYDYQILPNIPIDNNDEILDIIISEKKVITAIF